MLFRPKVKTKDGIEDKWEIECISTMAKDFRRTPSLDRRKYFLGSSLASHFLFFCCCGTFSCPVNWPFFRSAVVVFGASPQSTGFRTCPFITIDNLRQFAINDIEVVIVARGRQRTLNRWEFPLLLLLFEDKDLNNEAAERGEEGEGEGLHWTVHGGLRIYFLDPSHTRRGGY